MTGKVEINLVNEILNGLNNCICKNISDDDIKQNKNELDKQENDDLIKKEDLDDNKMKKKFLLVML